MKAVEEAELAALDEALDDFKGRHASRPRETRTPGKWAELDYLLRDMFSELFEGAVASARSQQASSRRSHPRSHLHRVDRGRPETRGNVYLPGTTRKLACYLASGSFPKLNVEGSNPLSRSKIREESRPVGARRSTGRLSFRPAFTPAFTPSPA